jgi:hypothetical protein
MQKPPVTTLWRAKQIEVVRPIAAIQRKLAHAHPFKRAVLRHRHRDHDRIKACRMILEHGGKDRRLIGLHLLKVITILCVILQ